MTPPRILFGSVLEPFSIKNRVKWPQDRPKGAKSPEKGHLKIHAKMDAEKGAKSMPKGSQNDAKMDTEIIDF